MGFTVSGTTSQAPNIETFKQAFETIQTKINITPAINAESQGTVYSELIKLTQAFRQTDFAPFEFGSDGMLALSDLIVIFSELKDSLGKDNFTACLESVLSHLQKHRWKELFLTTDSILKILPYLVDSSPNHIKEMLFEEVSLHLRTATNPLDGTQIGPLSAGQICNFIFCASYISNLDIKYVVLESLSLHVKTHLTAIVISNKTEYHDEKMASTFTGALIYLANFETEIKYNTSFLSFLPSISILSKVLTPFARNTRDKKRVEETKRENQKEQTPVEHTPFRPTRSLNKATSSLINLLESSEEENEEPSISSITKRLILPD